MTLEQELLAYQPVNEQEARDLPKMVAFLREGKTVEQTAKLIHHPIEFVEQCRKGMNK